MAPVKVTSRVNTRLNPLRLLKDMLNGAFVLTTRLIEWLLPYVPLVLLASLFIGDTTLHIMLEKTPYNCTYGGIEGYKIVSNNDCPLFRMLP